MRVNTNIMSMKAQNNLRINNAGMETTQERLSSGKRINSAADDAAGLAISSRMNAKINSMDVGIRNSNDGKSLVQTAESGLGSIGNILQRMRELAVQASNGTNSATDLTSLQAEYANLTQEIDHVANNTTFNGIQLLDAPAGTTVDIQLSDVVGDVFQIGTIDAQTTQILGAPPTDIDVDPTTALNELDSAITAVADQRATFGAALNRLNFNVDNMTSMKNNLSQAKSRIEDADMAAEVSEMTKFKVLTQSGISMLSQANQNPQMITQLLQN